MTSKKLYSYLLIGLFLSACNSNKLLTLQKSVEKPIVDSGSAPVFKYRLRLSTSGTLHSPHDDIVIDSNGQMMYDTEQHMKDGSWKTPKGLAYLEPKDDDTLLYFVKQDALFRIDELDVTPQCSDGDQYTIFIKRSDIPTPLTIKTNTCVLEYNLLTGEQRKLFPAFIAFIERIRNRYRPLYTE